MFTWFRPKIPVKPEVKQWVEARMGWLVEQFGWDRLVNGPTIVPNDEFFPDRFDGSKKSARAMFDRTSRYMDVDPTLVDLRFHYPNADNRFNPAIGKPQPNWAGLYRDPSLAGLAAAVHGACGGPRKTRRRRKGAR
jgi:hypothetical protein